MDDKTRQLLELLAEKLATDPVHLSEAVVNYTAHCAWMQLVAGIIWGLFALLFFACALSFAKEKKDGAAALSFLVSLGLLAVCLSKIFAAIPVIAEPMGATLQRLL